MNDEREWTSGELAAIAGVTVRALHHYDEIGLLVPSERSTGGHRRYCAGDVERLYRIVALRRLGMSLAAIQGVLDSDDGTLLEAVRPQLAQVEQELERWRRIRGRLTHLISTLERSQEPSPDDLLEAMEAISMTIRLDRIYTGTGDEGETELADGTRVNKGDPVVEGADLEELAAQIAVAIESGPLPDRDRGWLERVQNDLFDLGAPAEANDRDAYVDWLTEACEEANRDLLPLDSFVLPGGGPVAAQLHVCRIVCRRLERWAWAGDEPDAGLGRYLNRLADLLFILSRRAADGRERLWRSPDAR